MGAVFGAVFVIGLVVWGTVKAGKTSGTGKPGTTYKKIRCPTCGADARLYGRTWECGWCGDFGQIRRK